MGNSNTTSGEDSGVVIDSKDSAIISIQEMANLQKVSIIDNQNVLYWDCINYSVNDKLQGHLNIIKNVSGFSKSGRLLAIMGSRYYQCNLRSNYSSLIFKVDLGKPHC